MKKTLCTVLCFIMICINITGCYSAPPNYSPMTTPNVEEMEIYKAFIADFQNASTLSEMVAAFEKMCSFPIEVTTDMYLVEVHTSFSDDEEQIYCSILRQFEIPGYYEFIEIGFTVEYTLEDGMNEYDITRFFEKDYNKFLSYIKNSDFYTELLPKPIVNVNVGIGVW